MSIVIVSPLLAAEMNRKPPCELCAIDARWCDGHEDPVEAARLKAVSRGVYRMALRHRGVKVPWEPGELAEHQRSWREHHRATENRP